MTTEVVVEALESLGSQADIARLFKVSDMAVSKWINKSFPPSRTLELYHHCDRQYDLCELLAK